MLTRMIVVSFAMLVLCSCGTKTKTDEAKNPEQPPQLESFNQAQNLEPELPDTEQTGAEPEQSTQDTTHSQPVNQLTDRRKRQELELYTLDIMEEKSKASVGFISLSDSYLPNIPPDNVVFP